MREPAFIVVEGADGLGKTTLVKSLVRWYRDRHEPVLETEQPTRGPIGSLIRLFLSGRLKASPVDHQNLPSSRTMALLFAADRHDHVQYVIKPALACGVTVICDRYDLSTYIYQTAAYTAYDDEYIDWLRTLHKGVLQPNMMLVLRGSAELAAQRMEDRGKPKEIYETDAMQRRIVALYERAHDLVLCDNMRYVSAEGSPELVLKAALDALDAGGVKLPPPY